MTGRPLPLPSGGEVFLHEVLIDDLSGQTWVRFRFVAPGIGRAGTEDGGYDDMSYLCDEFALSYLSARDLAPDRVVISLADRVVPFGSSDPEATQYFGSFRIQDDRCIWEEY